MPLSTDDVRRIAHLARLDLHADEQRALHGQLNGFFAIVQKMSAVDTTGVEPLFTPLSAIAEVPLRLRDDAVTEAVDRDANLANGPAVADGLFLVPKVIE
jgi:aspartyl-tRNA(Asn)/glutamyl-tRNA(Gln) amidotransferase subunit C